MGHPPDSRPAPTRPPDGPQANDNHRGPQPDRVIQPRQRVIRSGKALEGRACHGDADSYAGPELGSILAVIRVCASPLVTRGRIFQNRPLEEEGALYRRLVFLAVAAFGLSSTWAVGDEWSPERAARYLDGRLQQWFAWKPAASPDGPCVSCHTGMTYLMARPALRRRIGESQPTSFETGLLDRLRAEVGDKPESYLQGVEVILAALFLSERDAGKPMSADTRKAFDQLWSLQLADGPSRGSWDWLIVDLDPWEQAESAYSPGQGS